MELGVAQGIGLANNHFEGCREERNNCLPRLAMGSRRKIEFVSAKLIHFKFDGKCFLLVHLWGRCFFHRRPLTAGQTIISVTLDKKSSCLLEEQTS